MALKKSTHEAKHMVWVETIKPGTIALNNKASCHQQRQNLIGRQAFEVYEETRYIYS